MAGGSSRRRSVDPAAGSAAVDAYLAALPAAQGAALRRLRRTIAAAAPGAEECISYGVPAFRLGRMLVAYGAAKGHCSFFLMSTATLPAHRDRLAGYDASGGTVRFRPDAPLPAALVRTLVKARIAEIRAGGKR